MLLPDEAVLAWEVAGAVRDCPDAGLINRTYLVGDPPQGVLQWLNPIFSPRVNDDIAAVTARLAEQGLLTPRLLPTRAGESCHLDEVGAWRMLSFVPGRTLHKAPSPQAVFSAGALVGRFHQALDGWPHPGNAPRRDIHNTPQRMADLQAALEGADGHPLEVPARALGEDLLRRWAAWEGTVALPERTCHGDLKLSNLRFALDRDEAICLLDLDTIGPMALSCELGDAWRSWCNPAGEDAPEAVTFDLDIFEASLRGFLSTAPQLGEDERQSLVPGVERICLELASRFCADAVRNSYFREDRVRFPAVGAHNLHRATAQSRLAQAARLAAPAARDILRRWG